MPRFGQIPWILMLFGGIAQFLLAAPVRAEAPARVAIVHGKSASLQAAASSLADQLRKKRMVVETFTLTSKDAAAVWSKVQEFRPTVVATGGSQATSQALKQTSVPVCYFMVPNILDAPFAQASAAHSARVGGVTADVPPAGWLEWAGRTAPNAKRIAVLYSRRTKQTADALRNAARAKQVEVVLIEAAAKKFPQAIDALNKADCQAVVMIPDAGVYNAPNVQRLLLWGVRQKKAVFSFSRNAVEAGAFCGLQSDPREVGRQTADLVDALTRGGQPRMQYPTRIAAVVNQHTAEMIEVQLARTVRNQVDLVGVRE